MQLKKYVALFFGLAIMFGIGLGTTNTEVQAASKTVEFGAGWNYGVGTQWNGKTAWSDLGSSSRWHTSSCYYGGSSSYSGNTKPGTTSRSWVITGFFSSGASSYYNIW